MSKDVSGFSEDWCGQPIGQQRSDHRPRQNPLGGVELLGHLREVDDENSEGEVQCEQSRQQAPQHPPLIPR